MRPHNDPDKADLIRRTWAEVGQDIGVTGVARMLDVTRDAVYRHCGEDNYTKGKPSASQPVQGEDDVIERIESGDSLKVIFETDRIVKTLDDAIKFAQVDTDTWFVDTWSSKTWTVALRVRMGQDGDGKNRPDQPHVKQMCGVTLKLKRRMPKPYQDATEAIFARVASKAPKYPAIHRGQQSDPCMLEIDLFDVHFGKLAWARETGEDYDLAIAERVYHEAISDLSRHASGIEVEQIVLPIGNDFFHVDNPSNTTTAGTPQDTDGRYAKIIEVGEMAVIRAIEHLREIAPVKVIGVPGNHDRTASFHLLRTLNAWFRNADDVDVDTSPKLRKYVRYGVNLIGFTHGNEENPSSLPIIMATESPQDWADTICREWHVGHWHKSKKLNTLETDDRDGVPVRFLRSLSAKDAWTYRRGYVGGRRAAEAFVFSKARGMLANYQAYLRASVPA